MLNSVEIKTNKNEVFLLKQTHNNCSYFRLSRRWCLLPWYCVVIVTPNLSQRAASIIATRFTGKRVLRNATLSSLGWLSVIKSAFMNLCNATTTARRGDENGGNEKHTTVSRRMNTNSH